MAPNISVDVYLIITYKESVLQPRKLSLYSVNTFNSQIGQDLIRWLGNLHYYKFIVYMQFSSSTMSQNLRLNCAQNENIAIRTPYNL